MAAGQQIARALALHLLADKHSDNVIIIGSVLYHWYHDPDIY